MLSRVADSLYWFSRYLERAEHTARMLDVNLDLMLDHSPVMAAARWGRLFASLKSTAPTGGVIDPYVITRWLTFESANPASIISCIRFARENARQIRDLISAEMWEQINRLYLHLQRTTLDSIWNSQPHEFFQFVTDGSQLFWALTDCTMCHNEGWDFLRLGRFLERASQGAARLDAHTGSLLEPRLPLLAPEADVEWVGLLRCAVALEPYCKEYSAEPKAEHIVEFLLLNPVFPHSVRFAVDRLESAAQHLSETHSTRRGGARVERLTGKLQALLSYGTVEEIIAGGLRQYLDEIQRHCVLIHTAIQHQYITYPIESALA